MSDASMKILAGQKALMTGANSGLGEAAAIALGAAGADVGVNYVTGEASPRTSRERSSGSLPINPTTSSARRFSSMAG